MSNPDEPMIDVRDLRRTFGATEAVASISFRVECGEIFGLLGPNDAGKTTTIRMLTGQITPSGGSATVAGCDVVKDLQRLNERIGVVFKEQNLYDRFSARQNLAVSWPAARTHRPDAGAGASAGSRRGTGPRLLARDEAAPDDRTCAAAPAPEAQVSRPLMLSRES
ncbi:MAG: ATP-binding cassette domain-containing protein [Ktedonobacterales bacterium]